MLSVTGVYVRRGRQYVLRTVITTVSLVEWCIHLAGSPPWLGESLGIICLWGPNELCQTSEDVTKRDVQQVPGEHSKKLRGRNNSEDGP